MNTGDLWPDLDEAEPQVLRMQAKLHQWATDSPDRRFCDLYNLVADPAFLVVAWHRVRGNRGARSAGVDGVKPNSILFGDRFLTELRDDLKAGWFQPLPVRERMIPKANGKRRRLGIPTARDRVVQASLKLVLEPIFEADFKPCSYGFRPKRRAQDAIAEVHYLASRSYEWVLEGDITACFDEISHVGLLDRVRARVGDKRVLILVKAFLKSGILSEGGALVGTKTGTPQGGILSPLLANVAQRQDRPPDPAGRRAARRHPGRGGTSTRPGTAGDDAVPLDAVGRLDEITGIGMTAAQTIIAEVGLDMGQFPTAGHLVSWAKLSPRTIQSGTRSRSAKTGKGNPYLKRVLGEAAASAAKSDTFLGERYRRLVKRRGKLKALVAVARSILVIVWHLLADPTARFHDLGADFYSKAVNTQRRTRNLVHQLEVLGHRVTLTPAA